MRASSRFLVFGLISAVAIFGFLPGCKNDDTSTNSNVVAITDDLFPLVLGHQFTYTGRATFGGADLPDPGNVYRTTWTVGPSGIPTPLGGTGTALIDSTRLYLSPPGAAVTVATTLLIRKDAATGDFFFLQTLGPFKRAFGITVGTAATDTLVFLAIARPSQGVGSTGAQWTAYDSTFIGAGNVSVRLQILGQIEAQETIMDSAATPASHAVYRSRTWRKITVGGTVVQDNVTTSQLWLQKDIGPIQVRIAEDTENLGHWRFFVSKNF
jgi:hypothetical protein